MGSRRSEGSRRSFLTQSLAIVASPVWRRSLGTSASGTSDAARSSLSRPRITFRDVAREAGITPRLVCGAKDKKYILEVNGSGCVWFDYNNDGYVDLYIANGSTIANLRNPSAVRDRPVIICFATTVTAPSVM